MAAAAWLRERAPALRVPLVSVVDLMTLFTPNTPNVHPHGMTEEYFTEVRENEEMPEIRDSRWGFA